MMSLEEAGAAEELWCGRALKPESLASIGDRELIMAPDPTGDAGGSE